MTTHRLGTCSWMLLIILPLLLTGCNADLDRDTAQKALSEALENQRIYLQVEQGWSANCPLALSKGPRDKLMEDKGWYRRVKHSGGCVFGMTPRSPVPPKPDAIAEASYGDLFTTYFAVLRVVRVDIDGIRPINENTRLVDYRMVFEEQFPGGRELIEIQNDSLASTVTAHFEKYDDGWRLKDFDVNNETNLGLPDGLISNSKKFDAFRSKFPDLDELAERGKIIAQERAAYAQNTDTGKKHKEGVLNRAFQNAVTNCTAWQDVAKFSCQKPSNAKMFGQGTVSVQVCGDFIRIDNKNCGSYPGQSLPLGSSKPGAIWMASVKSIELTFRNGALGISLQLDRAFPAMHMKTKRVIPHNDSNHVTSGTVVFSVEDAGELISVVRRELERGNLPKESIAVSENWTPVLGGGSSALVAANREIERRLADGNVTNFVIEAVPDTAFFQLRAQNGTADAELSYGGFSGQVLCREKGGRCQGCSQICNVISD